MKTYDIAVVGATGLVGKTFIEVLQSRKFPIGKIVFFASKRSAGKKIMFNQKSYTVKELNQNSFDEHFDFALFSAGSDASKIYAPIAASKHITVIDNSSAFRQDKHIPLVVPEVNGQVIKANDYLIANPNCSTIQSVVPIKIVDDLFQIKRIVYHTYQAVSGSGYKGIEDLENGEKGIAPKTYPVSIYDNVLPHIDVMLEDGYTKEEIKMIEETKKILNKDVLVTATCVRVPVTIGHSVAINIETHQPIDLDILEEKLIKSKDIVYQLDQYPTTLDAKGRDEVFVGRLRIDHSVKHGMNMWVVADNVRKGAATNTIQIAEYMIKEGLR